jgi:hypothetical protein
MTNNDYYINENGMRVFTEEYHLRRGWCCGSGCKHCPFEPKHIKGATNIQTKSSGETYD